VRKRLREHAAVRRRFGYRRENLIRVDDVMASLKLAA
jgi:hypothetical protein